MNKFLLLTTCFITSLFLGCAEIEPPRPNQIIESPLGKSNLHLGMEKFQVKDLWGDPDYVKPLPQGKWDASRELWVYEARFPDLDTIDIGYASRTKRLLFEGDVLVSINPEDDQLS